MKKQCCNQTRISSQTTTPTCEYPATVLLNFLIRSSLGKSIYPPCYLFKFSPSPSAFFSPSERNCSPSKRIIIICGTALESNVPESWSNYSLWQMGPLCSKHAAVRGHRDGRQTNCRGRAAHARLPWQCSGPSSHNINFKQSFYSQGLILCGGGPVPTASQSRLLHSAFRAASEFSLQTFSIENQIIRVASTQRHLNWLYAFFC